MYILITDPHFWSSSRKVVVEIITSQFFSLVVIKFFKAKTLSNSSFAVFLKASFVSMSFVSGFCYNIGFKWPDMSLTIEPEKGLTLWKKSFHLYGLNSFLVIFLGFFLVILLEYFLVQDSDHGLVFRFTRFCFFILIIHIFW